MRSFSIEEVLRVLYELQLKGIKPIIVHPESYNIGSVTGELGKEAKKFADTFLEHRIYSFIASESNRDENRNTSMSKGICFKRKNGMLGLFSKY